MNNSAMVPSDIFGDGLLFVGNATFAEERGGEFDLVVNCTKNLPPPLRKNEDKETKFIRLPVDDDPRDATVLYDILNATDALHSIDSALSSGKRVLIHCLAGSQRSAAVAACYLVKHRSNDVDTAIERVKSRRPIAFFGHVNFRETIEMIIHS